MNEINAIAQRAWCVFVLLELNTELKLKPNQIKPKLSQTSQPNNRTNNARNEEAFLVFVFRVNVCAGSVYKRKTL